ncbi:MAG: hypothetical protein ABI389_02435, partial [Rhodanobacter sp.]
MIPSASGHVISLFRAVPIPGRRRASDNTFIKPVRQRVDMPSSTVIHAMHRISSLLQQGSFREAKDQLEAII